MQSIPKLETIKQIAGNVGDRAKQVGEKLKQTGSNFVSKMSKMPQGKSFINFFSKNGAKSIPQNNTSQKPSLSSLVKKTALRAGAVGLATMSAISIGAQSVNVGEAQAIVNQQKIEAQQKETLTMQLGLKIANLAQQNAVFSHLTDPSQQSKIKNDDPLKNYGKCMFSVSDVLDELNRIGISNLTHSLGKDGADGWGDKGGSDPVHFSDEIKKQISEGANWRKVGSAEIQSAKNLEGMMMIIKPTEATRANGWTFDPNAGHIVIMDDKLSGFSDGEMKFDLTGIKKLVASGDIELFAIDSSKLTNSQLQKMVQAQAKSAPKI